VFFIVMELLEGQTLKYYVGKRPFNTTWLLDVGAQIADALDAAHAKESSIAISNQRISS